MDAEKLQSAIDYGTDAGLLRDPRLPRGLPRRRGPAGRQEPPLAVPELVDGEVGGVDDLRARDDARPDVAGRPGWLTRPRGRQGPRRDHRPRPPHDDLRAQVERRPRLQHLHDAGPRPGRAHARGRQATRHLLRVRAERGRATGQGGRQLRGRGRDGLRAARADDAARHRGGVVGLDPRPRRKHPGLLRRPDDARRLRPSWRPLPPWRRVEGPATSLARVHGAVGRALEDERLLRMADLAERRRAVHRPDGGGPGDRGQPRLPGAARRLLQLLGAVRAACDGLPDSGHRDRPDRPGPGHGAHGSAELGERAVQARARGDDRPDLRAARRRAARERGERGRGRRLRLRPGALRARPVLEGREPGRAAAGRPGARPRRASSGAAQRTRAGAVSCESSWHARQSGPRPASPGAPARRRSRARRRAATRSPPGAAKTLRFRLSKKARRRLRRKGALELAASARNSDAAGGTVSRAAIRVLP